MGSKPSASTEQEANRYRIAAEETLEQLDWCIRYFERIRKRAIADVVARNCSTIRRQMRASTPPSADR
jgi:hypothetical protein